MADNFQPAANVVATAMLPVHSPDVHETDISKQPDDVIFDGAEVKEDSEKIDGDRGIIVNADDMVDGALVAKKKKKKNRKPASKRGLGKPTGFEEFHADAPLTPEQYAESQVAFNPDQPFVDRVLKAIQRFERTRKLSPERRDIFYKYLAYGGVDVGPNMFVGAQNTEDMDKDEINATKAHANISDETKQAILDPKHEQDTLSTATSGERSKLHSPEYIAKYIVDFEGTMRGFLSRHAPSLYPFDRPEDVQQVTTTLERFMDYLLQHDVCPEYTTEVLNSRNLCRAAQTELWNCAEAQRLLPGDFNIACSTLFEGAYGRNYDGETYWGSSEKEENVFVGLKPEKATQIVGFAIAGAASEEVYAKYLEITSDDANDKDFEVVNIITDHGFEITKIEQPTRECQDLYKENTSEFRPVGKIYAKFYRNPDAPPEDLSPSEQAMYASDQDYHNRAGSNDSAGEEYIFFIEADKLFPFLRQGMRVEATIHKLNCSVWFFDDVIRVLPSFDLWIENEMMLGWKEPKPLTNAPDLPWNMNGERLAYDISTVDLENGVRSMDIDDDSAHQDGHAAQDPNGEAGDAADTSLSTHNDDDDQHPY